MVKTFKVGDHVSWNSEAGRVRGKSSKSIDGMLITKATFTVLPRTSRSTKRRSGLRGAPVNVGESQKCRIATCRFTASGFPPPSSLLYFPADSCRPWNERNTWELQLWFPNNLNNLADKRRKGAA